MKRTILYYCFICLFMLSAGCEDNGINSENISLAGNYDFVSMYEKNGQKTFFAGQPFIEGIISVTMTGDLVLTDKNYSSNLRSIVTIGDQTDTVEITDHGTYQIIDDNTMECYSEENNGTFQTSFLVEDDNLTVENDSTKMVWKKR